MDCHEKIDDVDLALPDLKEEQDPLKLELADDSAEVESYLENGVSEVPGLNQPVHPFRREEKKKWEQLPKNLDGKCFPCLDGRPESNILSQASALRDTKKGSALSSKR